jgi:hypothetical protein
VYISFFLLSDQYLLRNFKQFELQNMNEQTNSFIIFKRLIKIIFYIKFQKARTFLFQIKMYINKLFIYLHTYVRYKRVLTISLNEADAHILRAIRFSAWSSSSSKGKKRVY